MENFSGLSDLVNQFEKLGFCTLSNRIPPELVNEFLKAGSNIRQESSLGESHFTTSVDLERHPIFLAVLDIPCLLNLVRHVLGWNIRLSLLEYSYTPTECNFELFDLNSFSYDTQTGLGFHRDGARLNVEGGYGTTSPRYSVKAVVWLSDVNAANCGNLLVIPGSHLEPTDYHKNATSLRAGAIPILANRGDITLFERRLIHSRSPNKSTINREGLFIEFSYRWLKRKMIISSSLEMKLDDPVHKQLLHVPDEPWSLFWPSDDDCPLKMV